LTAENIEILTGRGEACLFISNHPIHMNPVVVRTETRMSSECSWREANVRTTTVVTSTVTLTYSQPRDNTDDGQFKCTRNNGMTIVINTRRVELSLV